MKLMILILVKLLSFSAIADSGTLIIAHGSMTGGHHRCGNNPTPWEKSVIDSVESIRGSVREDVELVFGMWNTMCYNMGINKLRAKLEAKGKVLDELNILPLFISSHSIVIEMQKWMFNLRWRKPIPFLKNVKKVSFKGKVNYLKAIDYDKSVSEIILDRTESLVQKAIQNKINQSNLEIIIVMHGPVSLIKNKRWVEMGKKYMADIMNEFNLSNGYVISLQDDAPKFIRNKRTKELREIVGRTSLKGNKALILPLLLSQGGIENGIIERLKGLDYIWTGETILPDNRLKTYLIKRIKNSKQTNPQVNVHKHLGI